MKILLIGSKGQLGNECQICQPDQYEIIPVDRDELDITDRNALENFIIEHKPEVIINVAAYTAVDKAEEEEDMAYEINARAVRYLAELVNKLSLRLIHISTDFVFDGRQSSPYSVDSNTQPLGVYGASKLAGEKEILNIAADRSIIVRTAWLYSSFGNNFVKTMLRLMKERDQLSVISDQIGTPTNARFLAEFIWLLVKNPAQGIFHWSDAGVASWYDFAVAIQEEACQLGLLEWVIPIKPINTQDYPTPATRPAYSVLDKRKSYELLGITPVHWRQRLRQMLEVLKKNNRTNENTY